MSKIWPQDAIRELIALADRCGTSRAELSSERDAERFRFAIYSFRRQTNLGQDLSITVNGNTVVIAKRETPSIVIT
jgi:hypothetical protein